MADTVESPSSETEINTGTFETGVIVDANFRRRRWYHRRDVRFVSLVVAFVIAFNGIGYVTGPSRITEALHAAIDSGTEKIDVLIWAKFPAEAFHMEIYQKYGRIQGNEGDAIRLARVKPADIRFMSRKYWIDRIDLAPPKKP